MYGEIKLKREATFYRPYDVPGHTWHTPCARL